MKVLHIGLASHFTEKMLYQDNILTDFNAKAGHEVTYISDSYAFVDGVLMKVDECDLILDNRVRLIRVNYDRIVNSIITNKVQKCKRLIKLIDEIKPDAILYHGVCGYELINVANYVKKHEIPFYIDSHENFKNTAMTIVSWLAYKYIHGFFVKRAIPYANKILYIGHPEKIYLQKMYHITEEKLEYFPLGGVILDKAMQATYRDKVVSDMDFPDDAIICAHSGKMDRGKRTRDVLEGFYNVRDSRLRLLIFGSIPDDMREELLPLIDRDERVSFLGWKNGEAQTEILGATDLYIQPGTYSATAQIALCNGCALIVNDGYKEAMGDVAFYEDNSLGIEKKLKEITENLNVLLDAKAKCYNLAIRQFNYEKLAERYLV